MLRTLVTGLMLAPLLLSQAPTPEKPEDPYTRGNPKAMARLGYVSAGPFMLGSSMRTERVDEVVGKDRMLWLETANFRLGATLEAQSIPLDPASKEKTYEEIERLRRKLRSVPSKPKTLDRWLRMHLFAQRLEETYAEFAELTGFESKDPAVHLGSRRKLLVLLFEKQSNMVRFFRRFTDYTGDDPIRWYLKEDQQMMVVAAADAFDGFLAKDEVMHCFTVHNLVHVMLSACHDYRYDLPTWFQEGMAHWFVRQIDERYNSVNTEDSMGIDYETAWEWERRVRARVGHDHFPPASEMLAWPFDRAFEYTDHMFMYSRVDFLLDTQKKKVGDFIRAMHGLPLGETGVTDEAIQARQLKALEEVFGFTPEEFDKAWKLWVLRTYPKR